jgi:hypothetical protein
MRNVLRLLTGGIVAASALSRSTPANGQSNAPPPANPPVADAIRSPNSANDSLYSFAESDFVVGKTVYLRSSKMRIGTILAAEARHSFPRTFPRPQMKAVLIRRKDGPLDWVPVERITRIYVVNR